MSSLLCHYPFGQLARRLLCETPRSSAALLPSMCPQGGNSVYVTGSFNAWGERIPLRRSGNDCVVCLNLLPGTYQYKFIVDNEWRFAPDQPTVRDEMGNINNCVCVEDQSLFMREEPHSGFFSEHTPNLYTQALPDEITMAKEPPQAPVHLCCLPLNMPSVAEPFICGTTLHPPLSVTLTHMCMLPSSPTMTLAMMQRCRHKFVTVLIYKPRKAIVSDDTDMDRNVVARDGMQNDTTGTFRLPYVTYRDTWAASQRSSGGRALSAHKQRSSGGHHLQQAKPTNAYQDRGGTSDTHAMPPGSQGQALMSGLQPMDVGSHPSSQLAFMETG